MGIEECANPRCQEAKLSITEEQLRTRVVEWQQRLLPLGVGHFRVVEVALVDECSNPDAAAGVTIADLYDSAAFEFDVSDTEAADDKTLDERIIHEWLHVAFRDYDRSIAALARWLPEATKEDFASTIHHEYEGVIERLARALYALHAKTC